jgi:hypothetical protein
VGLARRARLHARWGEGLILAAAAALFLLYLALHSGSQGLEFHALIISGIGGLMIGVLWLLETRQPEFDWACRVDRSLGLNGRLLAAMNVERSAETSSMGQLLLDGLRPRVSRKVILRRAVPVSLWLLVLPFVSGSLLMQGLQAQRNQVVRWTRSAPQFRQLQDRLAEAQQRVQVLAGEESLHQDLQAMQEAARRGGLESELGKGDSEEWSSELDGLALDIAQVSQALRGDAEWDRTMDQAQALVTELQDRVGKSPNETTSRNEADSGKAPGGSNSQAETVAQSGATSAQPGGGPGGKGGQDSMGQGAPGAQNSPSGPDSGEKARPERPGINPNWGPESQRLLAIPQVPRPYRSLVQSFLAAGQ